MARVLQPPHPQHPPPAGAAPHSGGRAVREQPNAALGAAAGPPERRMAGVWTCSGSPPPSCVGHNQWERVGKKGANNLMTLRCRICQQVWRSDLTAFAKCDAFFAGRCPFGGTCPYVHVYSKNYERKQQLLSGARPQAAAGPAATAAPAAGQPAQWTNHPTGAVQQQRQGGGGAPQQAGGGAASVLVAAPGAPAGTMLPVAAPGGSASAPMRLVTVMLAVPEGAQVGGQQMVMQPIGGGGGLVQVPLQQMVTTQTAPALPTLPPAQTQQVQYVTQPADAAQAPGQQVILLQQTPPVPMQQQVQQQQVGMSPAPQQQMQPQPQQLPQDAAQMQPLPPQGQQQQQQQGHVVWPPGPTAAPPLPRPPSAPDPYAVGPPPAPGSGAVPQSTDDAYPAGGGGGSGRAARQAEHPPRSQSNGSSPRMFGASRGHALSAATDVADDPATVRLLSAFYEGNDTHRHEHASREAADRGWIPSSGGTASAEDAGADAAADMWLASVQPRAPAPGGTRSGGGWGSGGGQARTRVSDDHYDTSVPWQLDASEL